MTKRQQQITIQNSLRLVKKSEDPLNFLCATKNRGDDLLLFLKKI